MGGSSQGSQVAARHLRLAAAGIGSERLRAVERAVRLESSWLHRDPSALHDLLYQRLRAHDADPDALIAHLTPRVRLAHPVNLGAELRQFRGHSSSVVCCAYSPDGSSILSASHDKTLREWHRSSGTELRCFEGHTRTVTACAYSADGSMIVSASDDNTLRVWDAASGRLLHCVYGAAPFRALAVTRHHFAAGDTFGNVWMFDADWLE